MIIGGSGMSIVSVYLIFSMLAVIFFDVTRYIIPNWLVGSLLILYPVAVWMSPVTVDWKMALVAMIGVFTVGYIVFSMRWMGGGDIKLITACALWTGVSALADFIFITAFLGGLFAASLWIIRKWLPIYIKRDKPWPRILREGEPVPYGVAIAITMLLLIFGGRILVIAHGG